MIKYIKNNSILKNLILMLLLILSIFSLSACSNKPVENSDKLASDVNVTVANIANTSAKHIRIEVKITNNNDYDALINEILVDISFDSGASYTISNEPLRVIKKHSYDSFIFSVNANGMGSIEVKKCVIRNTFDNAISDYWYVALSMLLVAAFGLALYMKYMSDGCYGISKLFDIFKTDFMIFWLIGGIGLEYIIGLAFSYFLHMGNTPYIIASIIVGLFMLSLIIYHIKEGIDNRAYQKNYSNQGSNVSIPSLNRTSNTNNVSASNTKASSSNRNTSEAPAPASSVKASIHVMNYNANGNFCEIEYIANNVDNVLKNLAIHLNGLEGYKYKNDLVLFSGADPFEEIQASLGDSCYFYSIKLSKLRGIKSAYRIELLNELFIQASLNKVGLIVIEDMDKRIDDPSYLGGVDLIKLMLENLKKYNSMNTRLALVGITKYKNSINE